MANFKGNEKKMLAKALDFYMKESVLTYEEFVACSNLLKKLSPKEKTAIIKIAAESVTE